MNKAQGHFGVETGDFNLYARPIPKCGQWGLIGGQRQPFTNTVTQH